MPNIYLILILGLLFRILFLNHHPLWFDENASLQIIQRPDFKGMISLILSDNHPPLYFVLLKLLSIMSASAIFLRGISLIFSFITIYVFYKLVSIFSKQNVAKFSSILTIVFICCNTSPCVAPLLPIKSSFVTSGLAKR